MRCRRRARPGALQAVGSTGSPLSPEGFQLGLRPARVATRGCSRPRAAPTCAPRSSAACRRCRCTSASCRHGRWARRSRRGIPTGNPLIDEVGELVITEPMPSMPIVLLGRRRRRSRYRETYFSMYPGIWRHGDWIEITSRGTAVIYGRSDSTINRGGVRMGTSEIYRAVLARRRGRRRAGRRPAARRDAMAGCRCSWCCATACRSDRRADRPRSAGGSARTARRATCPTRSARSTRCRARCRARCSRSRSSGS